MLRAEADIVHRKLAQYKGEKLEGLDVKTLGVLLLKWTRARTRRAARQRKLLTSCPDDFVCPITQELMVDPHVCADGHSYERDAIAAWLGKARHVAADEPAAGAQAPRAEYYVAERHRRVPRGEPGADQKFLECCEGAWEF